MADEPTPYIAVGKSDAPPKRGKSNPVGKTAPAKKPVRELMSIESLNESLKDKWTLIGMGVYRYNAVDGLILIGGTDDFIDSMTALAEKNVRVRRQLDHIANLGEGTTIFLPAANMVFAILANHGLYNGPLLASIDSYADKAAEHVDLSDGQAASYDEDLDADLDVSS
jgi:hypothetical protein